MSSANRTFYSLLLLVSGVSIGLGLATLRLLSPLTDDVGSAWAAIGRWCVLLLTGSPEIDELLLLGLIGMLPVALLLGASSFVRQVWTTQKLVRARTAARVRHVPRAVERLCDRLGITEQVDVIRTERPYSFCYGLVRPRVCLSIGLASLLTEAELEAVLLHERYHLRNRDPLRLLLARAFDRAFFFVPVIGELSRHFAVAKELAADRAVIAQPGQGRHLASALCKLITAHAGADGEAAVAGVMSLTDARIDHLLDPEVSPRLRFSHRALGVSVTVMIAVAALVLSPDLAGVGLHVHALVEGVTRACLL